MKTNPVKVVIEETPHAWSAEVWHGKELIRAVVIIRNPSKGGSAGRLPPQRTAEAYREAINDKYPGVWKSKQAQPLETFKSFDEFKQQQLDELRAWIIDRASAGDGLYIPKDFLPDFCTSEFVLKLAHAIRKPWKERPIKELELKFWLCANWVSKGLCKMTIPQLGKATNDALATKHQPGKVRQTAYRLGLFTDRLPGPVPRF